MLWGYSLGGKVQWLSTSISSRSLPWDAYVKDCVSSLHIGLRIPTLWASSLVISISVNQKKEGLTFGTKPSPTVTRERLQCFIPFFPHVLESAQPVYTRRDSTTLRVIRTLSRIDRIFMNLPMAEAQDFHCYSHVFENLGNRTIPSDHAVRLVIQEAN